jgi:hypothetical protein
MMLEVALGADAEAVADDDVIGMIDIDAPDEGGMVDVFPVLGVPLNIHVKLCFETDTPALLNLVTGEKIMLPDGDYTLMADKTWDGISTRVYNSEGEALDAIGDYFSAKVELDETSRFLKCTEKESGNTRDLHPQEFNVNALYLPFLVNGIDKIRLKVMITEWTNPKVFWEFRRLWFLFNASNETMTRVVTQHWRNYTQWIMQYTEPHLVLRPAFDLKSGFEQHYLRCSDQAGVSTAGLMLLAGHRFKYSRPEHKRRSIADNLNTFLEPFFEDGAYELTLDPSQATKPAINSTPATGTHELIIQGGFVSITSLLSADSPCRAELKMALEYAEDQLNTLQSSRLPIGTFVLVVFAAGCIPLTIEVCSQLAAIVDLGVLKDGVTNPMELVEDIPSCGVRGRHDRNLVDHLNMGGGIGAAGLLIQVGVD